MLRLQVARRRHIIATIAAWYLPSLSPTSSALNHMLYCHTNYGRCCQNKPTKHSRFHACLYRYLFHLRSWLYEDVVFSLVLMLVIGRYLSMEQRKLRWYARAKRSKERENISKRWRRPAYLQRRCNGLGVCGVQPQPVCSSGGSGREIPTIRSSVNTVIRYNHGLLHGKAVKLSCVPSSGVSWQSALHDWIIPAKA